MRRHRHSQHAPPALAKLVVVATTPDLGAVATAIGGDQVSVTVLAKPTEDPHFVDARPSHIVTLNPADVLIEGDFQGGTRVIALGGTGAASTVPLLAFSASSFGFGQSGLGVIQAQDFTISNGGQLAVTLERLYSLGDFVLRHNCPQVLEPGRSCTVATAFLPTLPGPRDGLLVIESSAEGSPHRIPLEGSGCRMYSLRGARLGLPSCAH